MNYIFHCEDYSKKLYFCKETLAEIFFYLYLFTQIFMALSLTLAHYSISLSGTNRFCIRLIYSFKEKICKGHNPFMSHVIACDSKLIASTSTVKITGCATSFNCPHFE